MTKSYITTLFPENEQCCDGNKCLRTQHSLYRTWSGMCQRCFNPKDDGYKNYGGRGISVYNRWKYNFEAFVCDIEEILGSKPSKHHSIDRINNDKSYYPSNLRQATSKEQCNNRRRNIKHQKHDPQTAYYIKAFIAKNPNGKLEFYNTTADFIKKRPNFYHGCILACLLGKQILYREWTFKYL